MTLQLSTQLESLPPRREWSKSSTHRFSGSPGKPKCELYGILIVEQQDDVVDRVRAQPRWEPSYRY